MNLQRGYRVCSPGFERSYVHLYLLQLGYNVECVVSECVFILVVCVFLIVQAYHWRHFKIAPQCFMLIDPNVSTIQCYNGTLFVNVW